MFYSLLNAVLCFAWMAIKEAIETVSSSGVKYTPMITPGYMNKTDIDK